MGDGEMGRTVNGEVLNFVWLFQAVDGERAVLDGEKQQVLKEMDGFFPKSSKIALSRVWAKNPERQVWVSQ